MTKFIVRVITLMCKAMHTFETCFEKWFLKTSKKYKSKISFNYQLLKMQNTQGHLKEGAGHVGNLLNFKGTLSSGPDQMHFKAQKNKKEEKTGGCVRTLSSFIYITLYMLDFPQSLPLLMLGAWLIQSVKLP